MDDHSLTAECQRRRGCRVQGGEELLRVRHARQVRLCRVQSGRRSGRVRDYGQATAQGGRQPSLRTARADAHFNNSDIDYPKLICQVEN